MMSSRLGFRLATRAFRNQRATIQRRFESTAVADKLPRPGDKLVGAADNAFNRERAAVKAHAAATSGAHFHFRTFGDHTRATALT